VIGAGEVAAITVRDMTGKTDSRSRGIGQAEPRGGNVARPSYRRRNDSDARRKSAADAIGCREPFVLSAQLSECRTLTTRVSRFAHRPVSIDGQLTSSVTMADVFVEAGELNRNRPSGATS